METAVARVDVLAAAQLVHLEAPHRRQRTVVRQPLDDREARPAVRAVDEGVAEPRIGRVAHLPEAVGADGRVDGKEGLGPARLLALEDDEPPAAGRRDGFGVEFVDPGERRRLAEQPKGEPVDALARPLDLDDDAEARVPHESGKILLDGVAEDARAETDALHPPARDEPRPDRPAAEFQVVGDPLPVGPVHARSRGLHPEAHP